MIGSTGKFTSHPVQTSPSASCRSLLPRRCGFLELNIHPTSSGDVATHGTYRYFAWAGSVHVSCFRLIRISLLLLLYFSSLYLL